MSLKRIELDKNESNELFKEIIKGPQRSEKRLNFAKECLSLAKERNK